MAATPCKMTSNNPPPVIISLDAVIVAVTEETPRILAVQPGSKKAPALPSGPLDLQHHETLERGLRGWVATQTGFDLGYVEQLYTFGDRVRGRRASGPRVVSTAYLALVREQSPPDRSAQWRNWYRHLPWEDWRGGEPPTLPRIQTDLGRWLRDFPEQKDRADVCFGRAGAPWDPERTLERYELLYEAGLVEESGGETSKVTGAAMAMDHRRILATALGRLRGKIKYRPVVFELLPERFTLSDLQLVVEALAGSRLHKQNFRRLVCRGGLVEATGEMDQSTGGRPAELFCFRREVLRERPAPGVHWSPARSG